MGRKSRAKRQRRQQEASAWEPFLPVTPVGQTTVEVAGETFLPLQNNRYFVLVRRLEFGEKWPAMLHLSIRRNDREPIHDWRDLQRIKNEIIGPENEAVELYPAESRLLDAANQYHLFVLEDATIRFPFGYLQRVVTESSIGASK